MSDRPSATQPERHWRVEFHTPPGPDCLGRPRWVVAETVRQRPYSCEGPRPHLPHYLFKLTLRGAGRYRQEGRTWTLQPGYAFVCDWHNPTVAYWYPEDGAAPWHFLYLAFLAPRPVVAELLAQCGPVFPVDLDTPVVRELLAFGAGASEEVELSAGQASLIVAQLLATWADSRHAHHACSAATRLVTRARRLLQTAAPPVTSVQQLARTLEVSPAHLCRVFRSQTGASALQAITRQRLQRACTLLRDPALRCKEVAAQTGYDTSSHFARAFRGLLGMTPAEYRRRGTPLVL